jgi:hypothetical protein
VARYSDDFRAPVIPRPWRRAAVWQHSNGQFGPFKSVPGLGHVDVNALHPDVPLSAMRLRPVHQPAKPGKPATGNQKPEPAAPAPVSPVEPVAPVAPVEVVTPVIDPEPRAPVPPQVVGGELATPAVTTTLNGTGPGESGSIVITVTVPLPATPAPVVVSPDLGPLEEQLTLAARSLQGAIDSLPERSES